MLQLTFKQTSSELMVRAAATVLFGTLARRGAKLVSVSDLTERPQYGFTASAATEQVGPKLVRITDLQDGRIDWDSVPFCECREPDKYLIRDDDLLFARTGATTGKTYLVRDAETAVFASYLIRVRPKPGVFAGYLHAFFQSDNYWEQISEEKEGSAQPNVNGEKLASLQLPLVEPKLQHTIANFLRCVRRRQDGERVELPELSPPLAEQRRVVARIEELAAKIHEARALRLEAAEEAEALVGRAAAERFDSIGNFVPLGDVCETTSGGTPSRDRSDFYIGNIPWVKSGQLKDNFVECAEEHISEQALKSSSAKLFPSGTLVVALYGANVGKTGVLSIEAATNQAVCAVFPTERVERDYVWWFLRRMRPAFLEASFGGAQPNISQKIIREAEIPVPSLPEQHRIVAELDELQAEVGALKRLQAETAAELDALLPAILDKAFKGEL